MAKQFDREEYEKWKEAQQKGADLQAKMNTSIKEYAKVLKDIAKLQKDIQHTESVREKLLNEQKDVTDKIKQNENEILKLTKSNTKANQLLIQKLKQENSEHQKILDVRTKQLQIVDAELDAIKEQTNELKKQAKEANKLSMGFHAAKDGMKGLANMMQKGFSKLHTWGVFEMDKEFRNATRSMGGGDKMLKSMVKTLGSASRQTTMMGVGAKDLAKMQQSYSEGIGRSVQLSEKGAIAMAGMAEGTGLGTEFASEMSTQMDTFGISVVRTGKIVENTLNSAGKMGVNGVAATKGLLKNIKLAQRFNFKNGLNGVARMSVEAERLKLDIEGAAQMAEKVFRPEGAIDMASQLSTMGGEFAKLGDPMQLMFKARNDFAGFTKDIGKATTEFTVLNKKTGEYEVAGGLAADRMRRLSEITGISVEKLQEMSVAQNRIIDGTKKLKGGMFEKDDAELIASLSEVRDGKTGIVLDGKFKELKDLQKGDLEAVKEKEKSLEKRAKAARTFDEVLGDLILQFKQFLLPFAQSLKDNFGDKIQNLSDDWNKNGFYKKLDNFVKGATDIVKWLSDFISNNPLKSMAAALTPLLGGALLDGIAWFKNGISLGRGFLSTTGGSGSFGGGSGGGSGSFGNRRNIINRFGNGRMGKTMGGLSKIGRGMGGFAGGALGAVSGLALDAGRNSLSNPDSDAGKVMGIGGNALSWGGTGAMLGSFLGPLGTAVGGIVGGVAGAAKGIYDEYFSDEAKEKYKSNTSSATSEERKSFTSINDGVVKFHPQDKFMKVNDSTMIAGTNVNGNKELAHAITGGSNSSNEIKHSGDLNININLKLEGNAQLGDSLTKDQAFVRRLSSAIKENITMAVGGGKLNPNPKGV